MIMQLYWKRMKDSGLACVEFGLVAENFLKRFPTAICNVIELEPVEGLARVDPEGKLRFGVMPIMQLLEGLTLHPMGFDWLTCEVALSESAFRVPQPHAGSDLSWIFDLPVTGGAATAYISIFDDTDIHIVTQAELFENMFSGWGYVPMPESAEHTV